MILVSNHWLFFLCNNDASNCFVFQAFVSIRYLTCTLVKQILQDNLTEQIRNKINMFLAGFGRFP